MILKLIIDSFFSPFIPANEARIGELFFSAQDWLGIEMNSPLICIGYVNADITKFLASEGIVTLGKHWSLKRS